MILQEGCAAKLCNAAREYPSQIAFARMDWDTFNSQLELSL